MLIYKYKLNSEAINEVQTIDMPAGANILSVQVVASSVTIAAGMPDMPFTTVTVWAEVVTDRPIESRRFFIAFTGSEPPHDRRGEWRFVSTLQIDGYVLHTYVDDKTY